MKRLALPLVGLLALSACKVRVELDTKFNADESGTVTFAIAFDEEFRQAIEGLSEGFGEAGGEDGVTDPFSELEQDAPEGWRVDRFEDGVFEGVRISRDFEDLSDLRKALSETEEFGEGGEELGAGAPTPDFGEEFGVTREGDRFTIELGEDAFERPSTSPGEENPFGGEGNPFGELEFEFVVKVTLPGKVLEHNADDKDGTTLTWRFDQDSEPKAIRAVSDASQSEGSDFPVVPIAAVAGAVLLGAVLFLMLRGRGGATPAPAGAGEGDVPPPPPPPEG